MGSSISTPDTSAKEHSDEIDRQIEEDSKRFKRECKVLVLGAGFAASFVYSYLPPSVFYPIFHDANLPVFPHMLTKKKQVPPGRAKLP